MQILWIVHFKNAQSWIVAHFKEGKFEILAILLRNSLGFWKGIFIFGAHCIIMYT